MSEVQPFRGLRAGRKRRTLAIAFAAGAVLTAAACQSSDSDDADPTSDIMEVNVTEDPSRIHGQPVIAVHPDDPDNLVYISTNHIPDEGPVEEGGELQGGSVAEFQCYSAYSTDGGETWTETTFPQSDRPFCGHPHLAVDPDGSFFVAYNRLGCPDSPGAGLSDPCDEGPGLVAVARSDDGGATWSDPIDTTLFRATTPRLRIDAETGKIYVLGGPGDPSPHALSVSDDQGATWSEIRDELPGQPFGNQIAVHDGILVTATALDVDMTEENPVVGTKEIEFHVSTDDGLTYTNHPVTDSDGEPARVPHGVALPVPPTTQGPGNVQMLSTDPVPWVTADPTATGRFALMVPDGEAFAVYVTSDSGETWTGPTVVPADGARMPWIEYGADGQLGVMWRTLGGDLANAYATVSFDGGESFGEAVRMNSETHRWGYGTGGGDEWSRILFEGDDVYVTWTDGRTDGSIDGIIARAPLSLFED